MMTKAAEAAESVLSAEQFVALPRTLLQRVLSGDKPYVRTLPHSEDVVLDAVANALPSSTSLCDAELRVAEGERLMGLVQLDLLSGAGLRRAFDTGLLRDAVTEALLRRCEAAPIAARLRGHPPHPIFDSSSSSNIVGGGNIDLSDGGAVAELTQIGDGRQWRRESAWAAQGYSSGRHEWHVIIEAQGPVGAVDWGALIGVVDSAGRIQTGCGTRTVRAFTRLDPSGWEGAAFERTIVMGDVVSVSLDCNEHTIQLSLERACEDGKTVRHIGVPSDLPRERKLPWFPYVNLSPGGRVRFLSAELYASNAIPCDAIPYAEWQGVERSAGGEEWSV